MGVPSMFTQGTRALSQSFDLFHLQVPINHDKPTKQLYNATLPHELTLIHLQIIHLTSVLQFGSSLRLFASVSSPVFFSHSSRLSSLALRFYACFYIHGMPHRKPSLSEASTKGFHILGALLRFHHAPDSDVFIGQFAANEYSHRRERDQVRYWRR